MNSSTWKIFSFIGAAAMLAMLIVSVAMKGCTSMLECTSGFVPMKCHWTFRVTAYLGGLGCALGIVSAFMGQTQARRFGMIALILVAIVAIIVTTSLGIGTCAHADSGCHPVAYAVWICAGIAIVVSLIQLIKADAKAAAKPKMSL